MISCGRKTRLWACSFPAVRRHSGVYLDPAVPPVCNNDVSIPIHRHSSRSVKLTVTFSMRAELEQELAICIIHLNNRRRTSANPNMSFLSWSSRHSLLNVSFNFTKYVHKELEMFSNMQCLVCLNGITLKFGPKQLAKECQSEEVLAGFQVIRKRIDSESTQQ